MPDNILLVEDDKFLRDLMKQKLIKVGYNVLVAVDGEEGLKMAESEKYDIVLLDLILPGINGFEVLRGIKSNPKISSIPVIVLSNLGQKEDVERAMKLGAVDFMIKAHFTPQEIVDKIKSVIHQARESQGKK